MLIETKAAPQDKLCNQKHQNIVLNIFGVLELSCRLCKFTVALLQMSFSFLFGGVLCVFVIFEGVLGVFFYAYFSSAMRSVGKGWWVGAEEPLAQSLKMQFSIFVRYLIFGISI